MNLKNKIIVIDYGMGNILSVLNALNYLGFSYAVTSNPNIISNAKKLILPGVGSFYGAMKILKSKNIDKAIRNNILNKEGQILGICLGMQLLAKKGQEGGKTNGIGLIDGEVKKFSQIKEKFKIPHVGFNEVQFPEKSILYKNLDKTKNNFYFVHSYTLNIPLKFKNINIAYCKHGKNFIASFEHKNIFGTQFHPEKSQKNGLHILRNFIKN